MDRHTETDTHKCVNKAGSREEMWRGEERTEGGRWYKEQHCQGRHPRPEIYQRSHCFLCGLCVFVYHSFPSDNFLSRSLSLSLSLFLSLSCSFSVTIFFVQPKRLKVAAELAFSDENEGAVLCILTKPEIHLERKDTRQSSCVHY